MKIPKGYRRLRHPFVIRRGDKFQCVTGFYPSKFVGRNTRELELMDFIYIRKINRKTKKK